jgi:hypothetical protein
MTAVAPPRAGRASGVRLAALLAISYALRVCLAFRGGQWFWPDEARYGIARDAAYEFAHRQWGLAFRSLLGGADHVLFRWIGLPVAAIEYLVGGNHPALAACYFGLFSVGVIYLVWAVALRAGAAEPEALWSAFFAAAANSLFYYSRHYLPYDAALFGMMLSLLLAVGPWSARRSFLVGVAAGLAFLTYNGYWLLGGCILCLHALLGAGGLRRLPARALLAFLGLLAPIAMFVALGAWASGGVLSSYRAFAGSVKQGNFHVGFRVVPEYLWAAEGPMLVVMLAAFGYAILAPAPGRRRRLLWWASAIVGIYGGLVLFSDLLPVFMVYGRLSRCLIPFLCLGAGAGAAGFLEGRGALRGAWTGALLLLVAGLGAMSLSVPLRQVFPDRFMDVFSREVSGVPGRAYAFYRVLGTESLVEKVLGEGEKAQGYPELFHRDNPLQFRPYQFEGFTVEQRRQLDSSNVAMRVLETPMSPFVPGRWDQYPGPVSMTLVLPKDRKSLTEPLASSGRPGRGDIIFVRYVDSGHVQFGQDHWGAPPIVTKPVEVDYDRPHHLVISAGSLVPPDESSLFRREPWLEPMRGHLLIILDGRVVLSRNSSFYPAAPETILFGANLIGGSAVGYGFNGEATSFGQASLEDVAGSIAGIAGAKLGRDRPPEWEGAVGPVRIRFVMPPKAEGGELGQPLASVAGPGLRQVLFVLRDGGRVRFGVDTFGGSPAWSDPLDLSPTGTDEADVSIGSLLPDARAPLYQRYPGFARMRSWIYVRFGGRIVLLAPSPAVEAGACRFQFGVNIPGSTACGAFFMGEIPSIGALGLRDITVGREVPADALERLARPGWGGYPGPLKIGLMFSGALPGDSEPILTTGSTGAGDVVFVRYEAGGLARICLDHWGSPLACSDPFPTEPGKRHEVTLSLKSLFPPDAPGVGSGRPSRAEEQRRTRVDLDGRTILDCLLESHPAAPGSIALGANFIGGSSAGPAFRGEILSVDRAPTGDEALR